MKSYAEELKIQLSFKEEHEIYTDLGEIPLEDENGRKLNLNSLSSRRAEDSHSPCVSEGD